MLEANNVSRTALPAWFYDEMQQVGVDFEDQVQVAAYDRNQRTDPAKEQALINRLGITAAHQVIDLGTGTGSFAVQAARSCDRVYAVDISQAMLTYARNRAQGLTNIEFHHAGFLTYEHQAKPVNFVVTKAALHHLPDFWKQVALLRIAAMLKPGGILYLRDAVFSFAPSDYQSAINAWINRVAQPPGQGFTESDFEMHVREEHSTFGWIIEGMLKQAGFELIEADYLAPEYAQYVCRKLETG